ncbi:carbohydrate-binding module family 1 protein [Pyronema omphalodes]|nr:carbohydrate-binding module family 1 protein [Pyronema omphalodes]
MQFLYLLPLLLSAANAGTVIWDGRFNDYSTATDLNKWSWSNQVGSYQWYIHGTGPTTDYVNLSPSFGNPSDTSSKQGAKLSISPTALWNSDMWRTELILQTTSNLGTGKLWYHFSVKKTGTNPPNANYEHQVCFFESHFTELKFGKISGTTIADPRLQWFVGGSSRWAIDWAADVWHNFAYEIDFSAQTVGLWHSIGGEDLGQVVSGVKASTSTNSADWHLGILRLPDRSGGANDQDIEDWYFSGVYVESGSLNTKIGTGSGGGGGGGGGKSSTTTSKVASSTTKTTTTTSTPPTTTSAGTADKYAQCGGIGFTAVGCKAGLTCTKLNDYYYQCL